MLVTRNTWFLRRLAVGIVGIIGALTVGLTAQAQIFTGSINFLGNGTLNAPLGSATAFTSITGFVSGSPAPSGDFSGVPSYMPVTFTPFTFDPAPTTGFPLMNFTANSVNYGFEVTSISSSSQTSSALNLMGDGYILAFEGNNFNYSPATWSFDTLGASGNLVTFGANITATPVPEPNEFALLLIGALFFGGLMLVKRQHAPNLARVRGK